MLSGTRIGSRRLVALAVVAALTLWVVDVIAHGNGVAGKTTSATGCSCHSSTPNAAGALTVAISGSQTVVPGSTTTYTCSVTGGPVTTKGGLDLMATGGTLIPGTGSQLLSGDLVHTTNAQRSWTFTWTAPATSGTYNFYAIGMGSSGSGSGGDSWNWYGGAVNTPFAITVAPLVDVPMAGAASIALAPPAPNPSRGDTRIAWTMSQAGPVRIEVFDAAGRRVATPLAAERPAGSNSLIWNPGGIGSGHYVIRLSVGGRSLSRSLAIVR